MDVKNNTAPKTVKKNILAPYKEKASISLEFLKACSIVLMRSIVLAITWSFVLSFSGKAFDHDFLAGHRTVENDYEPIANIFPSRATATATVIESYASAASANQKKPELPPKPPGLQTMVEPGSTPKRVQAIYNFKGTNNDEVCRYNDFPSFWPVLR